MIYTDPKIEFIRFGGECDIITSSCTEDDYFCELEGEHF